MPYHISPNGSAGGCLTGFAADKRHNPFNLHYFRPYIYSPKFPGFWAFPCLKKLPFPDVSVIFLQIGSHRAEQVLVGHFIHFCKTRAQIGSRTVTGGICFSFSLLSNRHSSAITHSAQTFRQMLQCLSQYFYCFS